MYSSTNNALIGRIAGVAVDDSGRVFIADYQQNTIDVFEPGGRYITHLGRKGKGPGEFESLSGFKIIKDKLYTYDVTLQRINIFSVDSLRFLRSINMDQSSQKDIKALDGFFATHAFFVNKNRFLVGFMNMKFGFPAVQGQKKDNVFQRYYFMNKNGRIEPGEIFKQNKYLYLTAVVNGHRFSISTAPYLGNPLVSVSEDGHIFSAWTEDFLIREWNPDGKYQRAFYYAYKKVPLTRNSVLKLVKGSSFSESIVRQGNLPKTWPALLAMKVDDQNRLWISTIVKDTRVYQWWVLDSHGKLLTRFTWPGDKQIEAIKNGYIYSRETDTTKGSQEIVRYRFVLK